MAVGSFGPFRSENPEAVPAQDPYDDECERSDHVSRVAEVLEHVVVAGSKGITHTRKDGAPDGAADDRERQEFRNGHLAEPGGEGDKGTEERNEPPEQDD